MARNKKDHRMVGHCAKKAGNGYCCLLLKSGLSALRWRLLLADGSVDGCGEGLLPGQEWQPAAGHWRLC